MNPSGVLSTECDPCLAAENHNWMKAIVRFSRLFHYWMKPRYAEVLNMVWLPFLSTCFSLYLDYMGKKVVVAPN